MYLMHLLYLYYAATSAMLYVLYTHAYLFASVVVYI